MTKKIERIALLGTSADPPTHGHQALLEGLLKIFPKVITWASDNPIKTHRASLEQRYQLLNALVQAIADPRLELIQDISSPWTIHTLDEAEKRWPRKDLTFIVGSDLIEQIATWSQVKSILKKTRIGIAPRKGWPINDSHINSLKLMGGRIELLPLNIPDSSSSGIREKPKYSDMPNSILPIVIKENLYGLESPMS